MIADASVHEIVQRASKNAAVVVRSARGEVPRRALAGPGVLIESIERDVLEVHGLSARQIGEVAVRERGALATVITSEWTKLRTLRSTLWLLLAAVVAMAVLGSALAAVQMSRWSQLEPQERLRYDAIDVGVGGYRLAQLAIGVRACWSSAASTRPA